MAQIPHDTVFVKVNTASNVKEFVLTGSLRFNDYQFFRGIIKEIDKTNEANVILNLENLSFIDFAGIGMILIARDSAEKREIRFTMTGAQRFVRRAIEYAQIN